MEDLQRFEGPAQRTGSVNPSTGQIHLWCCTEGNLTNLNTYETLLPSRLGYLCPYDHGPL